ncbi:MAG: hypothetical protein U9Q79_02570, partial [Candidatus Hydrogenedentes bacterium]|nr:hypothetical protein [Candidatus Hydrogenedentota bacterium]
MRSAVGHSLLFLIPLLLVFALGSGCEGGGLDVKLTVPDAGDQPGGGDTGGDTGGGDTGGGGH